ncbi:hypothetical protein [Pseudohongiella acticola]|uniref:hypothetical protein n=1 Tax=Pseudohongiella acticola TaxID=1524254 RepID=UPI001113208C|nr:hypothetical protein [Pseudohongiella acticola]
MKGPCGSACVVLLCVTAIAAMRPVLAQPPSPDSAITTDHFTTGSQTRALESAESMVQAGELEAANIAFRRAFESIRAERGLFHEAQIPVLQRLLTTNLARRDWQQFNHYLDYHGALTHRISRHQPDRYAGALATGADWHQRAALVLDDELRAWHLIRARSLLWQAVSALEQRPANQALLSPLLYRIATLHYYLTTESSMRGLTSLETRTDQPLRVSGWSMSGSEYTRRSYAIGQELLERIYQLQTSADNTNHSEARINTLLADWQLMFGREDLARDYYRKAYRALLADSSAEPVLGQLFGQAVALPAPYFSTMLPATNDMPALESESDTMTLSDMNTSTGLLRPQLTDDFFAEDRQHELLQNIQ